MLAHFDQQSPIYPVLLHLKTNFQRWVIWNNFQEFTPHELEKKSDLELLRYPFFGIKTLLALREALKAISTTLRHSDGAHSSHSSAQN